MMRPFNRNERPSNMKPLPTLFKKRDHLKRALSIATTILSNHKVKSMMKQNNQEYLYGLTN